MQRKTILHISMDVSNASSQFKKPEALTIFSSTLSNLIFLVLVDVLFDS